MKIFISGGCKNGKSSYAQRLAVAMQKNNNSLYYIATMIPTDNEDEKRIERHINDRDGMGFETIELPLDIIKLNEYPEKASYLLDSVTALMANEIFKDNKINFNATEKVINELKNIISKKENIVIVSDYIYSDSIIYDEMTEKYRKSLASADIACAKVCDVVLEACYGNIIIHKGEKLYNELLMKIK